ncbi:MAG: ATP-binding protein [Planctomycetota bacterium]
MIRSEAKLVFVPKRAILKELEHHHFRTEAMFAIKLALEEALCNALKHGNRFDPAKKITIRYQVTDEKATIIVRDEGVGFEPEKVPDCTAEERLPIPNGRGIMLMKAYMDEVQYRDRGREVYFVKCCGRCDDTKQTC